MNLILKSVTILLLSIWISSCSNQQGEEGMDEEKTFSTPQEAADKAKNDLVEAIESNKDLNLGIDAARLKNASASAMVRFVEIDFEKLLSAGSVKSFSELSRGEKSILAPFVLDNEVVGIAEIARADKGWRVAGLGNMAVTNDLNESRILAENDSVTVYEIPNLNIMVYGVTRDAAETYYVNFDRFVLKEGVKIADLYPVIRESAVEFNRKFGEQLKKERLLK